MAKQKGKTIKTKAPKKSEPSHISVEAERNKQGELEMTQESKDKIKEVFQEQSNDKILVVKPTQAEQQAENLTDLHERTREWLAEGGKIQAGYQQNRANGNAKIIRDLIKVTRSRRKDWR